MGPPKLLLPWGETTVLGRTLENLVAAGPAGILVVSGWAEGPVRAAALAQGARVVHNPDWPRGMTGSLQAGLAGLPGEAAGALVVLADQPATRPATMAAILPAFRGPPVAAVVPVQDGRRGHPVLFGRPLFAALRALGPAAWPRSVLGAAGDAVLELEVDDPGIHADVDTWAEYGPADPWPHPPWPREQPRAPDAGPGGPPLTVEDSGSTRPPFRAARRRIGPGPLYCRA
jgi:molybdenum cofactor cytidylyltransferase